MIYEVYIMAESLRVFSLVSEGEQKAKIINNTRDAFFAVL